MSLKISKKIKVKENHKRLRSSKFEWATLIEAPSRKLKSFNRKIPDSTAGVAQSTYPKPLVQLYLIKGFH
jgi:hypothetical protein